MLTVEPIWANSPADIIAALLVKIGIAKKPGAPPVDWQVECNAAGYMPEQPDNLISCTDVQGRTFGNTQVNGATIEQYGVQVRIRARTPLLGNAKGYAIKNLFDAVNRDQVTLQGVNGLTGKSVKSVYEIQTVIHKGLLSTGLETKARTGQASNKCLFSINALTYIKLISSS